MENTPVNIKIQRIGKIKNFKITKIHKGFIEFHYKGSKSLMRNKYQKREYKCDCEGYLKLRKRNGRWILFYDIWPSKKYQRSSILQMLLLTIAMDILGVLMILFAFREARFDLVRTLLLSIGVFLVFSMICFFAMVIWIQWSIDVGIQNQSNILMPQILPHLSGIETIEMKEEKRFRNRKRMINVMKEMVSNK